MIAAFEAYAILRTIGARDAEFRARTTGVELQGHPVQHAIDSKGLPVLLVPLGDEETDVTDTRSRGISLTTHALPAGTQKVRSVIVRCLDDSLERQFFLLADDLVGALVGEGTMPGQTCVQVLSKWRELFEPNDGGVLSTGAQIGLLAELHLLEVLLAVNAQGALATWCGPDGARHDFVAAHHSVEVKATTNRAALIVGIHGAKQLEQPVAGDLWVYAEQMEESPSGDSLYAAVGRIQRLVPDRALFYRKLHRVGYKVEDQDSYRSCCFARLRTRLCLVDATFPRIVRASLANGSLMDRIVRLEYSIDLGPIESSVRDEDALHEAMRLLI